MAPIVFWGAWIGAIITILLMTKFIPEPTGSPFPWWIALYVLGISLLIRFGMLPRIDQTGRAFPVFLFGLALAEGCGLIAAAAVREHQKELLLASSLGVVLYMPLFLRNMVE